MQVHAKAQPYDRNLQKIARKLFRGLVKRVWEAEAEGESQRQRHWG